MVLDHFLHMLEAVHTARTQEEREAVYRFRYEAYIEEMRKDYEDADHKKGWIHDVEDDTEYATVFYTVPSRK